MIAERLRRAFWENPVVGRELTVGITGPKLGLVLTVMITAFLITHFGCYTFFWDLSGRQNMPFTAGGFLHMWHAVVAYGALVLFLPIRVAGNIESVRVGQAFDQVVVTGMPPHRVCFGAWLLGLAYAALLLAVTLPFEILAYQFGGFPITASLWMYGSLFVYSNLIIACTIGLSVVTWEWAAVPLTYLAFCVAGMVSGIPVAPSAIGEISPLRVCFRTTDSELFQDAPRDVLRSLYDDPQLFGIDIPVWIYTPGLWGLLCAGFLFLMVFGPDHVFRPGLNVFGTVVLPGDARRRIARRTRAALARRVEMAFYYENRPRWCASWDVPLRALVGALPVVLLVGGTMALAEYWPSLRRFERHEEFHISMVFCLLGLFVWMLTGEHRGGTFGRIGSLLVSRTAVHASVFFSLLALILWRGIEFADASALGSGAARGVNAAEYMQKARIYVLMWGVFGANTFLLGRALSTWLANAGAWRFTMAVSTILLLSLPSVVSELPWRVFHGDVGRALTYFSPFSFLDSTMSVSLWESAVPGALVVHAVFALLVFGLHRFGRYLFSATKKTSQ